MERRSGCLLLIVGVLMLFPATVWSVKRWWGDFTATRDCLAFVDRAAHAPTLDVAEASLDTAIAAAERRGWTSGNTGVFWVQTTNDVGFWFSNLGACKADLVAARKEGTQLAASNVLMRVRETLSRVPDSLAYHPDNLAWVLAGWVVWPLAVLGWIALLVAFVVLME